MQAMKLFLVSLILLFVTGQHVLAQAPAAAEPAVIAAAPAMESGSVSAAPAVDTVAVAEPAAPPKWAENLMVAAQKFPVIGPILAKVLLFTGIISSILTALAAFLLSSMSAISRGFNLAGLVVAAQKIEAFKKGKIMYWLQYFSLFNAEKPQAK